MERLITHSRRILIIAGYLLLTLQPTDHANASLPIPKVSRGHGLLLLDIQVDASSAVMTLKGVGKSGQITRELVPTHGRWLMISLPKGEYQIVNIKVPYFDLPYVNNTEKNPKWRIRINAGQLNYAGRIEVEKERTESYVAIKKLNRLVTDLPEIKTKLADILAVYPLADGGYLRDDFAAKAIEEAGVGHD